jgi:hypothetical protein
MHPERADDHLAIFDARPLTETPTEHSTVNYPLSTNC